MEYGVDSKWTGWVGGWGSESDIASILNDWAEEGWRLVRSEAALCWWFWMIPRKKLLMVFERRAP